MAGVAAIPEKCESQQWPLPERGRVRLFSDSNNGHQAVCRSKMRLARKGDVAMSALKKVLQCAGAAAFIAGVAAWTAGTRASAEQIPQLSAPGLGWISAGGG